MQTGCIRIMHAKRNLNAVDTILVVFGLFWALSKNRISDQCSSAVRVQFCRQQNINWIMANDIMI